MTRDDGGSILQAPIAAVTLLEDRARVTRRGQIALGAGRQRLVVEGVAPIIADKTVACHLTGGRVLDVRVRRRTVVAGEGGDDIETLREEGREARRLLNRLHARRDLLVREARGLDELMAQSIGDLAVDVTWGVEPDSSWRQRVDSARREREALIAESLEVEVEIRRREEELARLDGRIRLLTHPGEEESASIEIDVECPGASDARVDIEYVVPNACWRPYHRAEWSTTQPETMTFQTDACVWQCTGEEWKDVRLTLSTERASLGVAPPTLTTDELRTRRKSEGVVVEARDETVDTLGPEEPTDSGHRRSSAVPGIDDGGEVRTMSPADAADIPSDGRPHRIPLASHEFACSADLVAVPELAPLVYRRVRASNESTDPILAGPVDLILDGGCTGRTSTLYVAPGERFELSFAPLAALRVHRELEVLDDQSRMLSSWLSREYVARLRISNLGSGDHEVRIRERIPISEIDKVEIELDDKKTSEGHTLDDSGFVDWVVRIEPRGHARLELRYRIRRHESVQGL